MSCYKVCHLLPESLIMQIQEYVDGEMIYIPRKPENKKGWGSYTQTRQELKTRNRQIYEDYRDGCRGEELSERYYLSVKSIQRIIREEKVR